jgi:hypothetical protein
MRRMTKMRLKLLRRRNISGWLNVDDRSFEPERKFTQMIEDDIDLGLGSIFPVRGSLGLACDL